MTSELMNMVSPKRVWKVVGVAMKLMPGEDAVVHVDEGRLYAATSYDDAVEQAIKFWVTDMGFDSYSGSYARVIDRVGGYKVVLIEDGGEE
jgi:hypothetical protein